jgi:hypothetical protein
MEFQRRGAPHFHISTGSLVFTRRHRTYAPSASGPGKREIVGTGQWPALVGEQTWRAVEVDARAVDVVVALLGGGLSHCGGCGGPIGAGRTRAGKPNYRCRTLDEGGTTGHVSREPRTAFGEQDKQETTKEGVPKWEAQFVAGFRQFGRPQNEIIRVVIASECNPGEGIGLAAPVQLIDFEIGVMEKTKRDPETGEQRLVGVTVWYRCAEIRPTATTGSNGRPRPTPVEAAN